MSLKGSKNSATLSMASIDPRSITSVALVTPCAVLQTFDRKELRRFDAGNSAFSLEAVIDTFSWNA